MPASPVLAAGGVVLRNGRGDDEVLVVHRPSYDDWSLPKGKLDPGEDLPAAAMREVHEETGVHAQLGPHLGVVDYRDRKGRPKQVHWWAMSPTEVHDRTPDREVDEVAWVPLGEAGRTLTYRTDRATLATALDGRRSLLVIRHADAGRRGSVEPDHARPLSKTGKQQRKALVGQLGGHGIDTIVSSPAKRCRQTVKKLAKARDLEVVRDDRLAEGAPLRDVVDLVESLPTGAAICSHGDVIGDLVEHLAANVDTPSVPGFVDLQWQKASTWWLTLAGKQAVAASYLPPPG